MSGSAWPDAELRCVVDVRVSSVDKKTHRAEVPVRLCNYNDVYANDYVTGAIDFMTASAADLEIRRFGLDQGDIVITKDSESPDDIGVPAVVTEEIDGLVCGYHLAILRPRNGAVNPVYLAKQLGTSRSTRYFGVNARGTTRFGLPLDVIESMQVPLAPRPEQDKIADVLITLDSAVAQQIRLIAKLERIKRGLMGALLSRGVDEQGRLRTERTHEFKESVLGRIPVEWTVTTIGEQFALRTERGRAGLPVMSIIMHEGLVERSALDRRVETNLQPEGHALVRAGDIAYNMMRMWQGVLGRALVDCLVSPAYVVLRPRASINSGFAEWLFRDQRTVQEFRRWSRGVVDDRLRLYPNDLFPIKVAVPTSVDEQKEIAHRLEAIKARIQAERSVCDKYRRLRPGLVEDLLTGARRVTHLLQAEQV